MALFLLSANLGWVQGHFNFTETSLRYPSETYNVGKPLLVSTQVKIAVHVSTIVATRRITPMNARAPTMIKRLSMSGFMCFFLQFLSLEAEEAHLQVQEEHTLPLPPGMRDVHPSDSLLAGWTPRASGYRFRYPRMRNQRPSINDFWRTSLHVEAVRSVLLPEACCNRHPPSSSARSRERRALSAILPIEIWISL